MEESFAYSILGDFKTKQIVTVVIWLVNSGGSGSEFFGFRVDLLIDFGFGFNGFETFIIFWVWVQRVSKNPLGSDLVGCKFK